MPLKLPSSAASNMFGMRRPGSARSWTPQALSKRRANAGVGHVAIAAELVRKRSHVARALHVVLSAQRVDADAFAAEIAGGHRQVGDGHHHRRALAVLGDAEPVVDRAVAGRRRTGAPRARTRSGSTPVDDAVASGELRGFGDERLPSLVRIDLAPRRRRTARLVSPSVTTTWAMALNSATLVPGRTLQVIVGLDVRGAHEGDLTRDRRR